MKQEAVQNHALKKRLDAARSVIAPCGYPIAFPEKKRATAFAPSNIALCKYWGKRDAQLNLPVTSSLSLSLGDKGTHTILSMIENTKDTVFLNGKSVLQSDPFFTRISNYLDLFRPSLKCGFQVITQNNIPTAAGVASSASGFAALALALDDLFDWKLDKKKLSILARLGSGSACRSIYNGFVEWHVGEKEDGSDSYAEHLNVSWPELCLGILTLSKDKKEMSSRSAMQHTQKTSLFYKVWPEKVQNDLIALKQAIATHDFSQLGSVSESNAFAMHALMLTAQPSILYWQAETLEKIKRVNDLRKQGIEVYCTIDAGPNLVLLFEEQNRLFVAQAFDEMILLGNAVFRNYPGRELKIMGKPEGKDG